MGEAENTIHLANAQDIANTNTHLHVRRTECTQCAMVCMVVREWKHGLVLLAESSIRHFQLHQLAQTCIAQPRNQIE